MRTQRWLQIEVRQVGRRATGLPQNVPCGGIPSRRQETTITGRRRIVDPSSMAKRHVTVHRLLSGTDFLASAAIPHGTGAGQGRSAPSTPVLSWHHPNRSVNSSDGCRR